MQIKAFEIRDIGTFIPVLAFKLAGATRKQRFLLARVGYISLEYAPVALYKLTSGECFTKSFRWGTDTRTMPVAHAYITEHFDTLEDGAVIDVQFILGETDAPKQSEADEVF